LRSKKSLATRAGLSDQAHPSLRTCLLSGHARHVACVSRLPEACLGPLEDLVRVVHRTLVGKGKLLVCGNGGSASDAQHLVAELVGRYREERPALPAIALNADGAVLTCVANDYDYAQVFARQVEALGRVEDLFLVISTSGRSPNVVAGLAAARRRGVRTAALLGCGGGVAREHADLAIVVPDDETARIQECHGLMIHLLCEGLDLLLRQEAASQ
jgi:D-sedoheptulose 7-phosphate isomerase